MKKLNYALILVLISFITMSCSDENIVNNEEQNNSEIKLLNYGNNGLNKSASNQMLEFSDFNIYLNTIEQFENDINSLEDNFIAEYGYLNDEDLNNIEDEIGFNSDKPLINFENEYKLSSLRKNFVTEEENWLNHEVLDENKSPLDYAIYDLDITEMSVLNKKGEIKIGKAIYKKLNDSQIAGINNYLDTPIENGFIQIIDSNLNDLIDFNNGNYSLINQMNFDVMADYPIPCDIIPCDGDDDDNPPATSSCKKNKRRKHYFKTGNKKKVWAKAKMSGRRAKAKLRSYRKRGRRWRKWRTHMNVAVRAFVYATDCNTFETVNKSKSGRRKRIKAVKRTSSYKRVQQSSLANVLRHNGQDKILYLTW